MNKSGYIIVEDLNRVIFALENSERKHPEIEQVRDKMDDETISL